MLGIMAAMDQLTVGVACTRLVLLVTMHYALCSLPWFAGPYALHHGRYGPAGAACGAVHKTAEIPQLQFLMVVVIPVFTQMQIPRVLVTKRFPCCWT